MKILADTHIFLWAISSPDKLPEKWRIDLESPTNRIFLSAISVAEIMIKASIGKLEVNFDPVQIAEESGFEMLDFSGSDALLLKDLPFHHRDPFDRMLIAQAVNHRIPLMSDDKKFRQYDCPLIRES